MSAVDTNRIIAKLDEIISLLKEQAPKTVKIVSAPPLDPPRILPGTKVRVVDSWKWNGCHGVVDSVSYAAEEHPIFYVKLEDKRTQRILAFRGDQLIVKH